MSQIIRRPAANGDLITSFRYYARQASLRVADRFFAEAEATFARLARMPGLGTRYEPDEPLYANLRYFPISRFRAHIVFYRIVPDDGIEVFRVLHGAQDIHGILAEEFGVGEDAGDGQAEEQSQ
jgi:toxin ParE1/3/4